MPLPFNKTLDLKLIQLVKENPIIYDTKHPKHLDFDTREVTWQKIGDTLSRSAVEFAGIQCQIHYGDFQEEKHKPGLIENLDEYLPQQYSGSWGVEKKILKEFRRHQGLSSIEAKYLYTKTARAMPTYGVTFFLVKEQQKGKKKLVPRLLGINAESILRLDEVTKEILQVWPLTQVKTYHAGKSETFTLNFGDYSDKEYSVKTNDAHRIRDILLGYIDIIRKRMDAKFNQNLSEHHVISEDNIQASKGNVMEHIKHGPGKIIQETFVGPSKIISYEPGQSMTHGTQVVTVQQMIVTGQGEQQRQVMVGQVPMRHELELATKLRKLNNLNSYSVKIVTLLTDPTESNLAEAKKIVEDLEAEMPSIVETVQEAASKQSNEEAKKNLLTQLQELCDCTKKLSHFVNVDVNPEEASEAARRIADLSTMMYFSMDPTTKKRSEFCRRSRQSFVQDEKVSATLRRASAIAANQHACQTIDQAAQQLYQEYDNASGHSLTPADLERSAAHRLDQLNAAVAHYLTAFADPMNIDYSTAVTSMNTINEVIPKLVRDSKALGSIKDGKSRQELLGQVKALCDATKIFCEASDPDDHQKMQDAASEFGHTSDKLMFTLRRGKHADKHNEIIDLARDAGNKAGILLIKTNELTALVPNEPDAAQLDGAGVRCADAARDLVTCAALTASSIHEPHCQSALTAAAEALSSSAQSLAATWKPLVEDPSRKPFEKDLKEHTMELAKALDRLKAAYAGYDEGANDPKQADRLKFLVTVGNAKKRMNEAKHELEQPKTTAPQNITGEDLRTSLAARMDELNAALAALIAATADPDNPDYAAAEQASAVISELIPEIARDGKSLCAVSDPNSREQLLRELKALCDATDSIYRDLEDRNMGALNSSASKFANSSGKLSFMFNPRGKQEKEHQIVDLSTVASSKASELSAGANELAQQVGGQTEANVRAASSKVDHSANALVSTAKVSGSSIHEPLCQESLLSSADALSAAVDHLAAQWKTVAGDPRFEDLARTLDDQKKLLERELDRLRAACGEASVAGGPTNGADPKVQRLNFIRSAAEAQKRLQIAEKELDKPAIAPKHKTSSEELRKKLSDSVGLLNAALAALVDAIADNKNPDYAAADEAMKNINQLLPQVVKDGKALGASSDEQSRLRLQHQLRDLCDVTKDIYHNCERGHLKGLNSLASKFANSSGELSYMSNPQGKQEIEHKILQLSSSASQRAAELVAAVEQLSLGVAGSGLAAASERVVSAASALATTAQLTAPSIQEPRCQESLEKSANTLSSATNHLASTWQPLVVEPSHQALGQTLDGQRRLLDQDLDRLRQACREAGGSAMAPTPSSPGLEARRIQFVKSAADTQRLVQAAEKELEKPVVAPKHKTPPEGVRSKLYDNIARLNAAVAALVAAIADREQPDYAAADEAMNNINQLLPQVVKDTKSLSASSDDSSRAAMLSELKELCDATRGICATLEGGTAEELNNSAAKFASVSGRMVYVFNPRADQNTEHQILQLSSSASQRAAELVAAVEQLSLGVAGSGLAAASERVVSAASALATTAQLTAPSIQEPRCQESLEKSANTLSSATNHLASTWQPLVVEPSHQALGQTLDGQRRLLDQDLDRLRQACREAGGSAMAPTPSSPGLEARRIQFVKSAADTQRLVQAAEKELEKPVVAPKHKTPPEGVRSKLYDNIARLNAAVAALVAAMADREKPDYAAADEAMNNINQLLPQVVKDTKSLSATSDDNSRAAMLSELKQLCDATRGICATLEGGTAEELNNSAAKFASVSGRMVYVFNPRADQNTEHQILDLSSSACEKASELLAEVYQLAAEVGGEEGSHLDTTGAKVADAANSLLTIAQLTSPCAQDGHCRSRLTHSVSELAAAADRLAAAWAGPASAERALRLGKLHQDLDEELKKLLKACQAAEGAHPGRRAPPPPPRSAADPAGLTQTFLDTLRGEESHDRASKIPAKIVDVHNKRSSIEEKALQQKLTAAVDEAVLKIRKAEDDLIKVYNVEDEVIPSLSVDQTLVVQKQIEQKIAVAAAAAAKLVAANHLEGLDYGVASESTGALSEAMPLVVQDAKLLRGAMDNKERKAFLADLLSLFDATKVLIGSAKNDPKKINESAVAFGNRSAKILYVVSTDVDPAQEKEVLERARGVGDSASRLAVLGAAAAGSADQALAAGLCAAGGACADTAGTLVYTAKLVAPTIQHRQCQEALIKATDDLSSRLQTYSTTWEPLSEVQELREETDKLQDMLGALKGDLEKGTLVKRRPVERIVVENTPLRQLACSVLEDAKRKAEQTSTPLQQKHRLVKYANELGQAVQRLDRAYHASAQAPHDGKKRCNLENAIQNLQVSVLQGRPSQEERPQNNIVDLTDHVRDVSEEAQKLREGCGDGPELHMVREHCQRIQDSANRVMNPALYDADTSGDSDDIMEVEQFAQESEKRIKTINSILDGLHDGKQKIELQEKAARLTEASNILRFASKSALAAAQSVSLDATLEDLTDLELKIDEMLLAGKKQRANNKQCISWLESGRGRIVSSCSRVTSGTTSGLAPAFTAYVGDVTDVAGPARDHRAKEHLRRLMQLLKTLTMSSSRHVATWQPAAHPETAAITESILKELDNFQASSSPDDAAHKSALANVDINRLLLPTSTKVQVEQRQLPEKLSQAASKLSTSSATIMQSVHKPESLARSASAAVDAATHLAAVAASVAPQDASHGQRIDDATKEMSLQTYNVLKTADSVTQDPNNYAARRKLLDACRLLNDAINRLVREACPGDKLQHECSELTRELHLQQSVLHASQPLCALSYGQSVDALHNQLEIIQKLTSEEAVPRPQFARALSHVTAAGSSSLQYAAHCAYLLSISEQNNELATRGFVDVSRIQGLSQAVQDSCHRIIRTEQDQAKAEVQILLKQVQDYQQSIVEAQEKITDSQIIADLKENCSELDNAMVALNAVIHEPAQNRVNITSSSLRVVDATKAIRSTIERQSTAPSVADASPEAKARTEDVVKNCRNLNNKMLSLLREVKSSEDQDPMTWVTFGVSRKAVLDMFQALLVSVRENGKRAGILEPSQDELDEESNQAKKSYVQIQLELANKWLSRPAATANTKAAGEEAARAIISLGETTSEDLKDQEKEEMEHLVSDSKELLAETLKKYDGERARLLMERLKALKKAIERNMVNRVVEDFLEGEEPLADLDILADAEKDCSRRAFLLERKIAELLARLGRSGRTARLVAGAAAGPRAEQLLHCHQQTELLAPLLVKAAQQRVNSPEDQAAIEHYQKLLAQYAEAIANVRDLCDQAVDPMDFVQTAGETIQRMREETTNENDPQKCAYASQAITKLANRVINVGMSSSDVRKDPELQKALQEAKERLKAVVPTPNARPSRIPDWKVTTAEILRTTGEVESVLGGEMIFKKEQTSDQPIFAAALGLHAAVRGWSARDNDIVAAAKRMAVLMAKLSHYMNTDRKRDLIATSKAIVAESREVAELARNLARECTDVRITTNLLQVCERIPTISGQLKMLATVKGSSLGHQGSKEDQEDMNTLVGNAQNLMTSVQEVVKAAASASVKIMSERGGTRVRWVANTYY